MTYLEQAVALRPVRIDVKRDRFIYYEAMTFPKHPAAGCNMYLRRLEACGLASASFSSVAVDVLDADGSILETVQITKDGFEYLRRQLRFRVDRG
jgi:hypothetical protein